MVDKVQKIREEVEQIQLYTQSEVLKQVLDYIDEVQKESVSEEFEKKFISFVNATHDNNGSYSLHDFAQRLYNIAEEELKEPVSKDLEEAADVYSKVFSDIAAPYIRKDAFIAGAKWQQEIEYTCYEEAFEDGAKWKAEQFEKNRLKHCDSITNEQAELEQGFIDQHLDKYQRMPTFLDAIEYGMQTMKEQMMTKAIDAKIGSFTNGTIYDADFNIDSNLKDSDKVKVIVIKED